MDMGFLASKIVFGIHGYSGGTHIQIEPKEGRGGADEKRVVIGVPYDI